MYKIDAELKEFIESGVACLVGTGNAEGRPHVVYGWGPRVRAGGAEVDVFIDAPRSATALSDLRENPRIALTLAHPVSYRSVQLKGSFRSTQEPDDEDLARVQAHRDAFLVTTTLVGDPPNTITNLWMEEVVRVSFAVERAFDQTPGPEAGKPL